MSQANKSVLLQANAAMAAGDYGGFLAHCTGDTQWEFVGDKTLRGKAAVRQYIRDTYSEPPKFTVALMVADNDNVVAMGEITVKSPSGEQTRSRYCDVWRIREGKLAVLQAFVVELSV